MAYDFKRLLYGGLMFTATMYILLLIVAGMGVNYDKDLTDLGGELFEEDNWILGTTDLYQDAQGLRDASETASVTNLDIPTSSKSVFDQMIGIIKLPFELVFNVLGVVFQIPAPILYTLITLLTFEIILVVWRLLKQGD